MLQQLTQDMKAAMKAGEKLRLSSIRMLRAALKDKEIELGHALSDQEAQAVVAKLLKQRRDAARQYAEAGRIDLEEKELAEVEVFQVYMPEQLSDEALTVLVDESIAAAAATSMRDMGKVMVLVKAKAEGRADMGKLSAIVKARLNAG